MLVPDTLHCSRSFRPLPLMRSFVAALIAVAMAIFPITGSRSAALGGHDHHLAALVTHVHGSSAAAPCLDEAADLHATAHADGVPDEPSHGNAGQSCCGSMACHFFALSAAPGVFTPLAVPAPLSVTRDEQVAGVFSGRIERPPRTV